MTAPVMSPDGQFMWTGAEWIPAPPNSNFSPINVQDSVVMGNITNITNNNSQNDIENYFLTMLDAFAEGRDQAAYEILEKAKKINYNQAMTMFNSSWHEKISNSRLIGIELFYNVHLSGQAPPSWNMNDITTLPLIGPLEIFYTRILSLLEYDEENRNAWILLAEASIEYHSFKLSHPGGQSYAIMARDYFISIDDESTASKIDQHFRSKKIGEVQGLMVSIGILAFGIFLWVVLI
ncbi:MAG TPA: hypothetical protein D7I06_08740 [Candidatus Poseidoniales archaeon]|nr:MAG TPA: hypothetical protein D7I06_08740 [Candidatus Poseidoniales archaeon]HII63676.1 hypothetical protein [Candidatus Poseidoniaceae archaeon]